VGTPGRVLDMIKRKVLRLDSIRVAVLDEADRIDFMTMSRRF
jgi:superfamily II DNA/RNA helicase